MDWWRVNGWTPSLADNSWVGSSIPVMLNCQNGFRKWMDGNLWCCETWVFWTEVVPRAQSGSLSILLPLSTHQHILNLASSFLPSTTVFVLISWQQAVSASQPGICQKCLLFQSHIPLSLILTVLCHVLSQLGWWISSTPRLTPLKLFAIFTWGTDIKSTRTAWCLLYFVQ